MEISEEKILDIYARMERDERKHFTDLYVKISDILHEQPINIAYLVLRIMSKCTYERILNEVDGV